VHQYSIGVQREIPGNMVVDAAYVGSRTRGLVVQKGINEITAEQLAQGNAMLAPVANPFQGRLPGTAFNGPTVPLQQLLRPYPQFASITEDRRSLGKNDYDSLQLSLNKRMSKGVQFLVSYTYGKTMEEVAYLNPQDDWDQLLRVVTERDAPHRLMISGNWSLPFFSNAKGVMGSLLGGWQANGIVVFQSGIPTGGPAATAAGGAFLVGDPKIDNPTMARYFNTCTKALNGTPQNCQPGETPVWEIQPPFTLRTLPTRFDDIRAKRPGLVDFSVFKTFTLPATMRLQVRVESFNLFNTPWFPAPNVTATNAAFGQVTPNQANDPRNVQLGIRLQF
jgi:hypothetical protein